MSDNKTAFEAMKMRHFLQTGKALTNEDIIMDIFPADNSIKVEDIMRRVFRKYGTQYDSDSVRSDLMRAILSLNDKNAIVRVEHGVYKWNQNALQKYPYFSTVIFAVPRGINFDSFKSVFG